MLFGKKRKPLVQINRNFTGNESVFDECMKKPIKLVDDYIFAIGKSLHEIIPEKDLFIDVIGLMYMFAMISPAFASKRMMKLYSDNLQIYLMLRFAIHQNDEARKELGRRMDLYSNFYGKEVRGECIDYCDMKELSNYHSFVTKILVLFFDSVYNPACIDDYEETPACIYDFEKAAIMRMKYRNLIEVLSEQLTIFYNEYRSLISKAMHSENFVNDEEDGY